MNVLVGLTPQKIFLISRERIKQLRHRREKRLREL